MLKSILSPASFASLALLIAAAPSVSAPERPPMPVEAVKLAPSHLVRDLDTIGNLVANEKVVIRSEVQGRIQSLHFTEGQTVTQGDVLIRLDAAIQQAELAQAQASETLSRVDYKRASELLSKRVGSETDRDSALSQLRIDQAKVTLAQERLAKMTLKAPFDGVLGLRQVSPGDLVSAGQDLVTLVDLDPIKVEFRVPERFFAEMAVGQSVELHLDALPGRRFTGEIYALDPQLDQDGRSLLVRAQLPNPDGELLPGLFTRVRVLLAEVPDALLIPEEALVPQGRKQLVMRLVEGVVEIVPVQIGQRVQGQVEVTSGLNAGDIVVTAGQLKLRPGMRAQPVNLAPATAQ
ncbi:membrane fusion protein, multidrug efflux system [Allopseudospirillum japonicum]|uniref:Membrane fusion protein, multidrug efflux system n=1 Tax=Allopseudospirillum japonicum TaxID=64971 RepID=A0A1H6RHH1_9GAMM|nr:efflux RND transporter periplasmic adaptor subunit [Allopseudospirillum japonicum]SEI52744.1 membrane fusion protein, multidrug efflux system [Allopseudospirillum japonicum]